MPRVRYVSDINTNTSDVRVAETEHILSQRKQKMDKSDQEMAAVLDKSQEPGSLYQ